MRIPPPDPWLATLGTRLRSARERAGLSQARAARKADLSTRFWASLEAGRANISILKLRSAAAAVGLELAALLPPVEPPPAGRGPVIALIGLRGAGKSSIGAAAARLAGVGFFEHDGLIEEAAGLALPELFSLHGDRHYRELARETLDRFLATCFEVSMFATSGGIVMDEESFELLQRRTLTVWLRARPEDHWDRVVAAGDVRPILERPRAREELSRILARREPLYRRAAHTIDTTELGFAESVRRLAAIAALARERVSAPAPPPRG